VGLGLSSDSSMGQELVVLCSSSSRAQLYWNQGKAAPTLLGPLGAARVEATDGGLVCEVEVPEVLAMGDKEADLTKELVPLLASGSFGQGPSYHQGNRIAAAAPLLLAQVGGVGAKSTLLMQLHGILMLVAWIGCAGTGTLLARYYRRTWVGRQVLGKDSWFQGHRLLMSSTVLLSLLALVLAAIHLQGFSPLSWESVTREGGAHPPVGLASLLLAVTNPLMALARPHPGDTYRWLFNWAHWLVGNSAHVLALVAVYLASLVFPPLSSPAATAAWSWTLLAYVIFHVTVHLVLSWLWARSLRQAVDPSMELRDHNLNTSKAAEVGDQPGAGARKVVLVTYLVVTVAATVTLVAVLLGAL